MEIILNMLPLQFIIFTFLGHVLKQRGQLLAIERREDITLLPRCTSHDADNNLQLIHQDLAAEVLPTIQLLPSRDTFAQ